MDVLRYPRTRHLEGSRLQPGDADLSQVPFAEVADRHLVIEEKVDGANAGLWFTASRDLVLQSRGHALTGGSAHEAQFDLFKAWGHTWSEALWSVLGDRYVVYGENLYKKHTVYYDALPHVFVEFDVYDRARERFLSTAARRRRLADTPIVSVPVLHEGPVASLDALTDHLAPSAYKTAAWREAFEAEARQAGVPLERAWRWVDDSDWAEGLYVKIEDDEFIDRADPNDVRTEGRLKWVRPDFVQRVVAANEDPRGHVMHQPTIPNRLAEGVDLFAHPPRGRRGP